MKKKTTKSKISDLFVQDSWRNPLYWLVIIWCLLCVYLAVVTPPDCLACKFAVIMALFLGMVATLLISLKCLNNRVDKLEKLHKHSLEEKK